MGGADPARRADPRRPRRHGSRGRRGPAVPERLGDHARRHHADRRRDRGRALHGVHDRATTARSPTAGSGRRSRRPRRSTTLEETLVAAAVRPRRLRARRRGHIWSADEVGARCVRVAPGGEIVDEVAAPEGLNLLRLHARRRRRPDAADLRGARLLRAGPQRGPRGGPAHHHRRRPARRPAVIASWMPPATPGRPPMSSCHAPTRSGPRTSSGWRLSAYMLGRDDDYFDGLERALPGRTSTPASRLRAVRCAFWLGLNLLLRGETGRAAGWLGRAQRLLEREERDCVERGYLLIPLMFRHEAAGELEAAAAIAGEAARGRRALRRPRPVRARRALAGLPARQAGAGATTVSRCSTRRWSRSPPASCRRSPAASSTAA